MSLGRLRMGAILGCGEKASEGGVSGEAEDIVALASSKGSILMRLLLRTLSWLLSV